MSPRSRAKREQRRLAKLKALTARAEANAEHRLWDYLLRQFKSLSRTTVYAAPPGRLDFIGLRPRHHTYEVQILDYQVVMTNEAVAAHRIDLVQYETHVAIDRIAEKLLKDGFVKIEREQARDLTRLSFQLMAVKP